MQFSHRGRIQTRLITLLAPCALAMLLSFTPYARTYWKVVLLMATVGLLLDVSVYSWLIGYQPRWLTIALGVFEFGVLKWLMEWPYPLDIHLRTKAALTFYGAAWLLGWLLTQVVLPRWFPRWREDGGALWRPIGDNTTQRRVRYLRTVLLFCVLLLPWGVAYWRTPVGMQFMGLLVMRGTHWHVLAQNNIIRAILPYFHTDLLSTYLLLNMIIAFFWLLYIEGHPTLRSQSRLLIGALPPLLLAATDLLWLLLLVMVLEKLLQTRLNYRASFSLLLSGWLLFFVVWGGAWRGAFSAEIYLPHREVQAIYWLQSCRDTTCQTAHLTTTTSATLPMWIDALTEHQVQSKRITDCQHPLFVHGTRPILCRTNSTHVYQP